MSDTETLSVAEVSALTGFSRMTIYRAVRDGRLNRWLIRDDKGQARLSPDAAVAIRRGVIRRRIDSQPKPAPAPVPEPQAENPVNPWVDIASWANQLIDVAQWGPPPWPADKWATLEFVLDMADNLAAEHGSYTAELFAKLQAEGVL
jgi:hypothetical protein